MTNQEYLKYLKQTKILTNGVHSRYQLDEDNPYAKLQAAHDSMFNEYIDQKIQRYEIKAMEEMVSNYMKNINIDVSLDGQTIRDSIVKEINKGFRK